MGSNMGDEHIRGLRNCKVSTQIRSHLWDTVVDCNLLNQVSVKVRCQVLSQTLDQIENLIWNQIDNQITTLKE